MSNNCVLVRGGSPGLMVMGGGSYTEGRRFESQHHIFSHQYVVKILCWFEETKINEKEAGDGPFLKETTVF